MTIDGDATRITQVLTNMLHNASKFSGAGTTIGFLLKEVEGLAVFTVSDNGIGIPVAMQDKVFDMFAQVDPEELA
jgi:signal transduction histidine kinase